MSALNKTTNRRITACVERVALLLAVAPSQATPAQPVWAPTIDEALQLAVAPAGLLPILWGGGIGPEVMLRIAAPMVGGMVTASLLSMFVIPAAYALMRGRRLKGQPAARHISATIKNGPADAPGSGKEVDGQ